MQAGGGLRVMAEQQNSASFGSIQPSLSLSTRRSMPDELSERIRAASRIEEIASGHVDYHLELVAVPAPFSA